VTDISATSFFRRHAAETIEPAFEPEGGAHPRPISRQATLAPDFEHEEIDTGGMKRPTKINLHALDPDTGDRMGTLTYHVPARKADKILIEHLGTEDAHRRKGVGSALMDEMQRRHPGTPIDHGDRTDAGKAWWNGYTDGKKVTRGRTMASAQSPEWIAEWGHGSKPCPCCQGKGEHGTGFECYLCDGGMAVGKDTPENYRCDGTLPDGGHGKTASADTPIPDNHQPYEHEHPWLPRDHFFAPTPKGLDERLFDGDHMRPDVRRHILGLINSFWAPRYGDSWQTWARVYLAGSEASHFYGNNDLDVLIGIDHDALNQHVDAFCGEPDAVIDEHLTDELREHLNDDARMLPGPSGETGPWESTFFVNAGSWDIRAIKPYAAYDITRDEWAVRPVEVPDDFGPEKLPESTWDVFEALQTLIKAVAELPEGTREREGAALYDYLHTDRHSAFGPDGTGLYDPANVIFKALNAAPGSPLKQLIDWKHAHDGASATDQENAA
jgi:GNAT superfamily N-acetyltransferase